MSRTQETVTPELKTSVQESSESLVPASPHRIQQLEERKGALGERMKEYGSIVLPGHTKTVKNKKQNINKIKHLAF